MNIAIRKGFTLIEMLLVIAIIGILFTAGGAILNKANKNFILSKAKLELQTEARSIMYLLTKNIRQAQNSTITISRYDNKQPFYSKITFTTISGQTFIFYQRGVHLVMQQGNIKKVLTRNLRYLAFTFPESDDMGIISLSITLEKSIYEAQTKALHMASEKVEIMN